jgi:regulator of sirC expression with transglutaminase-like and TPR domain
VRRRRQFVSLLAVAVCLGVLNGESQALRAATDESLLARLEAIEAQHGDLCPLPVDHRSLSEEVKGLVLPVPPAGTAGRGSAAVAALNRLVFQDLGIRPSNDLKDPCNLLPSAVLEHKQGYCVGLAALYLVLAERLELPIYAVATPSHVFLRYDDGTTRINIETLRGGGSVPDEQYTREEKIPEESIRRGVFMQALSANQFLAQVYNNLGVVYSERGEYEQAAGEYRYALRLDPHLPAAYYNQGNDLLKRTQFRRAIRFFSKSLRLYPTDVWALNNRGLAYKGEGKVKKARRDFEEALRIEPGFEQARKNLAASGPSP